MALPNMIFEVAAFQRIGTPVPEKAPQMLLLPHVHV